MTGTAIRIVIADDQDLVRDGISFHLDNETDIEVIGSVADADSAVGAVIERKPDIALLDMEMPGRSIFDAVGEMQKSMVNLRVVFITAFPNDSAITQAIGVKASGIVTKGEAPHRLVGAVRAVHAGDSYFSEGVLDRLEIGPDGVRVREDAATTLLDLSKREREVLRYTGLGMSNKDMATTMFVAVKTVENHTNNLMDKLDIHNRVDLARFAIRHGVARP